MQRPTHVAICWWDDAWGEQGEVRHRSARPYPRVSAGFLLQDDSAGVCIAGTYDPPDKVAVDRTFIPRGAVQRVLRTKIRWPEDR